MSSTPQNVPVASSFAAPTINLFATCFVAIAPILEASFIFLKSEGLLKT